MVNSHPGQLRSPGFIALAWLGCTVINSYWRSNIANVGSRSITKVMRSRYYLVSMLLHATPSTCTVHAYLPAVHPCMDVTLLLKRLRTGLTCVSCMLRLSSTNFIVMSWSFSDNHKRGRHKHGNSQFKDVCVYITPYMIYTEYIRMTMHTCTVQFPGLLPSHMLNCSNDLWHPMVVTRAFE